MRQVSIPGKGVNTDYLKFYGGLDLVTPVLSIKPGNALDAVNYEPGVRGGFRRIDGYERFDGRPAPSAAIYVYMDAVIIGTIEPGNVLTGVTSGATATVLVAGTNNLAVTGVVGTFQAGEEVKSGGIPVAHLISSASDRGARTSYQDAVMLAAAADHRRASIVAVPGSGPVRGVWVYKGVVYAFRDNVAGTACVMHKASNSGWLPVELFHEANITTSGVMTLEISEGVTVVGVTSGASAVVKRVMKQVGDWPSSNVKAKLILSNVIGTFGTTEAIKVGGTTCGTLTAKPKLITLLPGGRYEFRNYNFTGNSLTARMYGCDGKNRAFEFDGTVYAPIETGMAQDNPKFIEVHKKKLFLAYQGSLQNSGDGLPYMWTVVTGAAEMALGDDIVGMAVQPGDTLAVMSRNSSWQVNGATSNSFQLLPISGEVGAVPYTVQSLGRTYALDDRGIIETSRVQTYGNFDQATVSMDVQPVIDRMAGKVVASTTYNSRNQYRLYCNDGSGLIMTLGSDGVVGMTQLQYPTPMAAVYSCEDANGKSVIYMAGTDGFVYQGDRGSSFDGAEIEAHLRLPYSNLQSPRFRKRYRKAVLEMSAAWYSEIRFQPEFSYGSLDISTHRLQTAQVTGSGGMWDVSTWGEFFYDAPVVSAPEFGIEGTGLNMSLLFYSSSAIDLGHALQGVLLHSSMQRLAR